jgi:hypothetical protein
MLSAREVYMRLFQVTEYVKYGLRVARSEEPRVLLPIGCTVDIRLHPRVLAVIERVNPPPEVQLVAKHMSFQLASNALMILRPPLPDEDDDDQALVHVATAGGVGGKAYLTANVLKETDNGDCISKRPSDFPSLGVQPLCTDEELARVRGGVDILDVVLLMRPGANFCVRRTGGLEGAPPVLSVRWNRTRRLSVDGQEKTSHTGARQARAVPTEAFAG